MLFLLLSPHIMNITGVAMPDFPSRNLEGRPWFLRDLMNGYALVAASKNHRSPMSMMAVTYEEIVSVKSDGHIGYDKVDWQMRPKRNKKQVVPTRGLRLYSSIRG